MFGLISKLAEILSSHWGRILSGRQLGRDADVARHLVRVVEALQDICVRGERLLVLAEKLLDGGRGRGHGTAPKGGSGKSPPRAAQPRSHHATLCTGRSPASVAATMKHRTSNRVAAAPFNSIGPGRSQVRAAPSAARQLGVGHQVRGVGDPVLQGGVQHGSGVHRPMDHVVRSDDQRPLRPLVARHELHGGVPVRRPDALAPPHFGGVDSHRVIDRRHVHADPARRHDRPGTP
ncbi:hypothetical protein [Streptomyces sp. BP-8]|uniref:Transposase n=1 Tax=Streptomyces sirii TaxID=3127701 RepID=A0ABZ2QGQ9_9ACTN